MLLFLPCKKFCCENFSCQNRQKRHFCHGSWLSSPLIKHPSAKGHHPRGNRSEKLKLRPRGRAKPETKLLFLSKNLLIFTDPHEFLGVTLKETQFEVPISWNVFFPALPHDLCFHGISFPPSAPRVGMLTRGESVSPSPWGWVFQLPGQLLLGRKKSRSRGWNL